MPNKWYLLVIALIVGSTLPLHSNGAVMPHLDPQVFFQALFDCTPPHLNMISQISLWCDSCCARTSSPYQTGYLWHPFMPLAKHALLDWGVELPYDEDTNSVYMQHINSEDYPTVNDLQWPYWMSVEEFMFYTNISSLYDSDILSLYDNIFDRWALYGSPPEWFQDGGAGFKATGGTGFKSSGGTGFKTAGGTGFKGAGGTGFKGVGGTGFKGAGGTGFKSTGGSGFKATGGTGFKTTGGSGFKGVGGTGFKTVGGNGFKAIGGTGFKGTGGTGFKGTGGTGFKGTGGTGFKGAGGFGFKATGGTGFKGTGGQGFKSTGGTGFKGTGGTGFKGTGGTGFKGTGGSGDGSGGGKREEDGDYSIDERWEWTTMRNESDQYNIYYEQYMECSLWWTNMDWQTFDNNCFIRNILRQLPHYNYIYTNEYEQTGPCSVPYPYDLYPFEALEPSAQTASTSFTIDKCQKNTDWCGACLVLKQWPMFSAFAYANGPAQHVMIGPDPYSEDF